MSDLHSQWLATWRALGAVASAPDPALYQALTKRYEEPQRKYHTLQHLQECFASLPEIRHLATHPAEVEMALWFHDAIYDVMRHDNEEQSARWASTGLQAAGVAADSVQRIHDLILATRHSAVPQGMDAAILVDVDLAILGAPPARFAEYEQQIRAEYAHIPDFLFRPKRGKILRGFLERPRIFNTQEFFERYEQVARRNIAASLATGRTG